MKAVVFALAVLLLTMPAAGLDAPQSALPSDSSVQIGRLGEFLDSWRLAWSSLDLERYLEHYGAEFRWDGGGLDAWRNKKKQTFKSRFYADVQIDQIAVTSGRAGSWIVEFRQNYFSDSWNDVGFKKLEIRNGDRYRIVSEKWRTIGKGRDLTATFDFIGSMAPMEQAVRDWEPPAPEVYQPSSEADLEPPTETALETSSEADLDPSRYLEPEPAPESTPEPKPSRIGKIDAMTNAVQGTILVFDEERMMAKVGPAAGSTACHGRLLPGDYPQLSGTGPVDSPQDVAIFLRLCNNPGSALWVLRGGQAILVWKGR
ncbi:hypothetical protein ACFLU6_01170 [Acidobacteriota bacterium]